MVLTILLLLLLLCLLLLNCYMYVFAGFTIRIPIILVITFAQLN
jgi:hypothetical protein